MSSSTPTPATPSRDGEPSFSLEYRPLELEDIEKELETLQTVEKELESSWETESAKYEESMERTIQGETQSMPRRNYYNLLGTVEDPTLYPYHDTFYSFLDAYDWLYEHHSQSEHIEPHSVQSLRRSLQPADFQYTGEGHLKVSVCSVADCLIPHELLKLTAMGGSKQEEMWAFLANMFCSGKSRQEIREEFLGMQEVSKEKLSPYYRGTLPEWFQSTPRSTRVVVLLKLLRHAISELQRDYYLVMALLTRMAFDEDMDDPDVLRRILCIFSAEFIPCEFPCSDADDESDHICDAWEHVLNLLRVCLTYGLARVSDEHAVILAAFVKSSYQKEFAHLLDDANVKQGINVAVENKRRTLLKRTVVAIQYVDRAESYKVPVKLIVAIIKALGVRAWLERQRCRAAVERENVSENQLKLYLNSYWNCVRALVDIGSSSAEILPPESECFEEIASEIVKSLAHCFLEENTLVNQESILDLPDETDAREYLKHSYSVVSLLSPERYLDGLVNATDRWKRLTKLQNIIVNGGKDAVATVLDVVRPDQARDVVRRLFVRDMVNIRSSGLGYGDFLTWCGYEVDPLDPVLFWHEFQYPIDDDSDDSESDDEENDVWDEDEAGHGLTLEEMHARYQFTTMALLRVWNSPWTPATHRSFQPEFQQAVHTLALCTHRRSMPNEIAARVASFLNRKWWPDSRRQCWSYDCQLEQIATQSPSTNRTKRMARKRTCQPCSGCGIAWYCSKKCKDDDYKAGHKRLCGTVLTQHATNEEGELYHEVFGNDLPGDALLIGSPCSTKKVTCATLDCHEEHVVVLGEDDDDDDGSWESMDSDVEDEGEEEGSASSRTKAICRFFKSKAKAFSAL